MSATARDPRQLLGLAPDADPTEVERHYRELQGFLDLRQVPRSLRPWAIRQRALVDEAYAALASDLDGIAEESPDAELPGEDGESTDPDDDEPTPDPDVPDGSPPSEPPAQSANGKALAHGALGQAPRGTRSEGLLEIVTEDQGRETDGAARRESSRRPSSSQGRASARDSGQARSGRSKPPLPQTGATEWHTAVAVARAGAPSLAQPWQRVVLGLALGLAILGALYIGTKGLPSFGAASAQSSSPSAEARQQQAQLDQQRVAELKAIVEKDPTNKDALFALGEMYIEAGKWQDSLDWLTRFLAVEPDSLQAQMDVGTNNFNLGRTGEAKQIWEEVARRSPDDPQIHYNLGFLYTNAPAYRDLAAARREWQKVLELAPNTEIAKAAQSGLDTLPKVGQ